MLKVSRWKVLSVGSAAVLCAAISLNFALAQKPPAKGNAAAAAGAPAKPRGRLPAYYKDIVDDKQRDAIYSIQSDFNGKIDALKEQIDKLTADRDAAVENVLTPAQKTKLKAARDAAAAKKKKPDTDKAEESDKAAE